MGEKRGKMGIIPELIQTDKWENNSIQKKS